MPTWPIVLRVVDDVLTESTPEMQLHRSKCQILVDTVTSHVLPFYPILASLV